MKILLIASYAGSIISFRGELIKALVDRGCEVHIAAPAIWRFPEINATLGGKGACVHELPLSRTGRNPFSDARLLRALTLLVSGLRPDVILPYTIKPVIYGTIAAWLLRVPRRYALVTGLGYAFTGVRRGILSRVVRSLYRFALSRTHKVFFQNPDDEALFRAAGILPAGVPSVVVNGSGVDLAVYSFQRICAVEDQVFLMIGRLLGDKGVREYASAARKVRAKFPRARFQLAGWIDENPDAIAQSELDLWTAEGTLEFLGRLDDVRPAIAACTVYVLPSYREGTPRTVLEAMAMGRPVITTDAPGCRETVVNGENGYLVAVQSVEALVGAMQSFIDNPGLAAAMGLRSRQIVEDKYDVHKVNAVMLREMGITGSDTRKEAQA
jgi:glycosyltransferase involved in cell wall biosynthesis